MRFLLVFLFTSQAIHCFSQTSVKFIEAGLTAVSYKGDLNSAYEKWGAAGQISVRFNKKSKVNGKLTIMSGYVTGQNKEYIFLDTDGNMTTPNQFFKTNFTTVNYDLILNLYNKKGLNVYLSQGMGIFRFKPKDENNQPLVNNLNTRDNGEAYPAITFFLPTQLGVIYTLKEKSGFGIQAGFLNPQTDYMDNISNWGKRKKKDNILQYRFFISFPVAIFK
jgi:hypothetical protein